MMNIEEGKVYTFNVDCINETHDGRKYIYFKEEIGGKQLRVKAFDFLAQPDVSLPSTIDVVVKEIDVFSGLPTLYFSKTWLIDTLYGDENLPKKFSFNIVKMLQDGLAIKDSFGVVHYFPILNGDSLDNYSIGEQITLFVDSIEKNAKNVSFLKLRKPLLGNQINQYIRAFTTRDYIDEVETTRQKPNCTFNYGEESSTVEFKQSLVYHPQFKDVQISRQIYNIMRSIAGFMNHDGGILYIGVKDNGSVNGIHNDFDNLCEENGYTYPANWDGWSRKVVDSVRKYLGHYAAGLINIEKLDHGDKVVGKITISKSSKPIFVNNTDLFCRQCNETAKLTGDALTMFIIERLKGDALGEFIDNRFGYDTDIPDIETDVDEEKLDKEDVKVVSHKAIDDERNMNDWLHLQLYDDGRYILTKPNTKHKEYDGKILCDYQLKQYHKHEDQVLLLLYNNALKVNKIDFANGKNDWYASKMTALQSSAPWVEDNDVSIRCVDRNDLLVAFYTLDNKDYCYVRDVSAINPSQANRDKALYTGGHTMTPKEAQGKGKIMCLPGSYRNWIAPIVNKRCEINAPGKSRTIQRLIDILNELYPDNRNV